MSTVKELQTFLKDRGVVTTSLRKPELLDLVKLAIDLKIEVDPDGIIEDREEIIAEKLTVEGNKRLCNPVLLKSKSRDMSVLPPFSEYDILKYLEAFASFDAGSLRDLKKMEGYSLALDGISKVYWCV